MRAIPASSVSHTPFLFPQPAPSSSSSSSSSSSNPISKTQSSLLFSHPFHFKTHYYSLCTPPSPKPKSCSFKSNPFSNRASKPDSTTLDDDDTDDDSGNLLVAEDEGIEGPESLAEDGVYIEVMNLEKNSRRIESRISIDAPLDSIWRILTDYDGLADFIPGLVLSKAVQKRDKFARLFQLAEQSLAFGIKFDAKGFLDCYEKDLETFPSGMKREIEFKMIEGDFQLFEGKWSILQLFSSGSCEESQIREVNNTTLTYIVDVKPKLWLPVRLIEGRLCSEIKKNLISIRDEVQKANDRTVHAR